MAPRTFFITGTSTGFGSEYVKVILRSGDCVVATARNSSKLDFTSAGATEDNFLAVDLDVTDKSSIEKAFDAAIHKFGTIDVVCNNAGYGLAGEFESLSEKQIRTQMEINFFGLLDVTRKALSVMREQGSGGNIQQVTSIGGQVGFPLFSMYCASKWAVEGFSEAVQAELKPEWNIHLTCIEPGGFRTDWAGRSMDFASEKNPAYDHVNAKESMGARNGTQAGDPPKAAKVFYDLGIMEDPPMRCIVGTDAFQRINKKLKDYGESVKLYEKWSNSTDVDGYKPPS